MTSGNERHVEAGQGGRTGETSSGETRRRRCRTVASIAFVVLAASTVPTLQAMASTTAPSVDGASISHGNTAVRVELAAGFNTKAGQSRKAEGDARVAPPRGSSAQLQGGSSADRYGGTSADRGGVAGARDARNRGVHQRPFNTGPDAGGKKGNKHSVANEDDERNQDDEEE